MAAATRGRPAVLDKVELELADGTQVTVSLVGEGDTIQLVLPAQWNVDGFSRSVTASGGRTRVSFVSATKIKAKPKAKPAPKAKEKDDAEVVDIKPTSRRGRGRKADAAAS